MEGSLAGTHGNTLPVAEVRPDGLVALRSHSRDSYAHILRMGSGGGLMRLLSQFVD